MKRRSVKKLICILLTGSMLLAGCGASDAGSTKTEAVPASAEEGMEAQSTAANDGTEGAAEVSGEGPNVDEKVT